VADGIYLPVAAHPRGELSRGRRHGLPAVIMGFVTHMILETVPVRPSNARDAAGHQPDITPPCRGRGPTPAHRPGIASKERFPNFQSVFPRLRREDLRASLSGYPS
jgi:hypothetical protein